MNEVWVHVTKWVNQSRQIHTDRKLINIDINACLSVWAGGEQHARIKE